MGSSIHSSPAPLAINHRLFAALVDDAGLFPPAELSMRAATDRHRRDALVASPVLSHRFICPAGRLEELRGALVEGDRFEVSVIAALNPVAVQAVVTTIESDARLILVGLEGVLPPTWQQDGDQLLAALRLSPAGIGVFVEVPIRGEVESAVAFVAANDWSVKLRCGGVRAELFPTSDQLATAIVACASAGVAFKATAGLHHAVRYRDRSTGLVHHGFLNILVAVARAGTGDLRAVVEALNTTDVSALVTEARRVDAVTADRVRAAFTSYGACSTSVPIEDLSGLLSADHPWPQAESYSSPALGE